MNIFGKLAVSALALSIASVASAAGPVSGTTDFRVTLPEVLVLYHWNDAHLIINDTALAYAVADNAAHNLPVGYAAGASGFVINTGAVTTTQTGGVNLATLVNVKLKDSWAVRSLSSGNVSLALTVPNPTLKNVNAAASTVGVQNATLASAGLTAGTSLSIPSGFAPVLGDIDFKLNLANANNSGEYNTRGMPGAATNAQNATDTFLLTLSGAPVGP